MEFLNRCSLGAPSSAPIAFEPGFAPPFEMEHAAFIRPELVYEQGFETVLLTALIEPVPEGVHGRPVGLEEAGAAFLTPSLAGELDDVAHGGSLGCLSAASPVREATLPELAGWRAEALLMQE